MLTLTLPFPPTVNHLFQNAAKGRVKTAGYRAWLKEAGLEIMAQKPRLVSRRIAGPYSFSMVAERPDNRRRDLANLEKAVSDLLVSTGLIADDSEAQSIELRWSGIKPAKPGRVHVTVMPI